MRVFFVLISLVSCIFPVLHCWADSEFAVPSDEREIEFSYALRISPPKKKGPIDIFVPLARTDEHQQVISRVISADVAGKVKKEMVYGNEFWHGHADTVGKKPILVRVDYKILRRVDRQALPSSLKDKNFSEEELARERLFLKENIRVPVSGSLISKIQKDLPETNSNTPLVRARVVYDFVVDTMEYKKIGKGWGNGDTHWACSAKYGNCTDFHALFISLARAERIPAKFEIGFPIPEAVEKGEVKGYHCWVSFKLPQVGWTPIDASEAKKHPEKREQFFGTHPADRIKFSEGRDLELGSGHTTGPLNYFIYPHIEVNGAVYENFSTEFRFSDWK